MTAGCQEDSNLVAATQSRHSYMELCMLIYHKSPAHTTRAPVQCWRLQNSALATRGCSLSCSKQQAAYAVSDPDTCTYSSNTAQLSTNPHPDSCWES